MTNFPYNSNVPNPPDSPSADVGDMQINSGSIAGILAVDHIGFNLNNGGYHTILHQPNNANGGPTIGGQSTWNPVIGSGVPAAVIGTKISGVQQTFTMNYLPDFTGATPDTQLFSMTGGGGVSQLTGAGGSGNDGWCWVGGVLLQWGVITSTATTGNVIFKDRVLGGIPFPNNCYNIQLTPTVSANTNHAETVYVRDGFTNLGFTWDQADRSTSQTRILWFAVGN